jgi:hypothetical protein
VSPAADGYTDKKENQIFKYLSISWSFLNLLYLEKYKENKPNYQCLPSPTVFPLDYFMAGADGRPEAGKLSLLIPLS